MRCSSPHPDIPVVAEHIPLVPAGLDRAQAVMVRAIGGADIGLGIGGEVIRISRDGRASCDDGVGRVNSTMRAVDCPIRCQVAEMQRPPALYGKALSIG